MTDSPTTSAGDERHGRIRWSFIVARVLPAFTIALFLYGNAAQIAHLLYFRDTTTMWVDAHIYFRATQAWATGANPWDVTWLGIPYAGLPTTLLLNVPLLPFGEDVAVAAWAIADGAAAIFLIRRLGLPWYWLLFHPIFEAFFVASPDLLLAALVFLRFGGLAAATKPYAIPALLAARRYTAVVVGAILVVAVAALLPWDRFLASSGRIGGAFQDYTTVVSAFGDPILMVVVAIALVSLGPKRALWLATPGLLAQQPHYLLFSLSQIRRSLILTWTMALPIERIAAVGVVLYALWARSLHGRWRRFMVAR